MKMHCETCCADMAHRYNDGVWVHGWHPSGSTHPYVFRGRSLPQDPSRDDRPGTELAPPLPVPSRDDRPGKAPPPMAFPGRSSRDDLIQPSPQGPSRDDRPGKALAHPRSHGPSRDDRPGKAWDEGGLRPSRDDRPGRVPGVRAG